MLLNGKENDYGYNSNFPFSISVLHSLKHQLDSKNNRSTELAIIDVVDKITKAIDEEKFSVGIFLDLSKAFDAIDHKILIKK